MCRLSYVYHFPDKINVEINMDGGLQRKKLVGNGNTGCSQWVMTDAARISPSKYWSASGDDYKKDSVGFIDETKYYSVGGVLLTIVQKSRVRNPVTLDGLPYSCRLYGDGRIQHFGIEIPDQMPANIYMSCEKVSA